MPGAVVLPLGGGIDGAFGDGSFETLYNTYGYVSKNVPGIHWFPYEICHLFSSKLSQFGFLRLLQVKVCLVSAMTHLYNGTANCTIFSER